MRTKISWGTYSMRLYHNCFEATVDCNTKNYDDDEDTATATQKLSKSKTVMCLCWAPVLLNTKICNYLCLLFYYSGSEVVQ